MDRIKQIPLPLVALVLIAAGLAVQYGLPNGATGTPTAVVIVEERADRPTLPAGQILLLQDVQLRADLQAAGVQFACVDQNVKDADGNAPPELVPFLDAAKGLPLPVVAMRYSGGRIVCEPLPSDVAKLRERLGL
jgi:hypothetical protein